MKLKRLCKYADDTTVFLSDIESTSHLLKLLIKPIQSCLGVEVNISYPFWLA